jgi:hypothetical protein
MPNTHYSALLTAILAVTQTFGAPPTGDRPPAAPSQERGNATTRLSPVMSGKARFQGVDVQYVLIENEGVPQLGFLAPVELARDGSGKLEVHISDPDTGGPFRVSPPDGPPQELKAEELARAVHQGTYPNLDRSAPVLVRMDLLLHSSDALRNEVLITALDQMKREAKSRGQDGELQGLTLDQARRKVQIMLVQDFRLRCRTFGLEDDIVCWEDNPSLAGRISVQARVPVRFIAHLYGPTGVDFVAEYRFRAFNYQVSSLRAQRIVDELIKAFFEEEGDGRTSLRRQGSGDSEEVEILVTREKFENMARESRWSHFVEIVGGDPAILQDLITLWQGVDADTFKVAEHDVGRYLLDTQHWKEALEQEGYRTLLARVQANEQLNQTDLSNAWSEIQTLSKSKARGGGLTAIFKGFGLGGNYQSFNAFAKGVGNAEQAREAVTNFLRALNVLREEGYLPMPKKLDLYLVSEWKLRRQLVTHFQVKLAGLVGLKTVVWRFNSAQPALEWETGPSSPSPPAESEYNPGRSRPVKPPAIKVIQSRP